MSHIQFSDNELKSLLNDERNCVKLQKGIKHISLHPFYLNNVAAGIAENLNKLVSKYDKSLKGIILAYKKPRLQQSNGIVHNDKGSIFVDVEAEFYMFCPEENCHVKAIVNKTGQDHIGCLIHKAFNVSVPKPLNEVNWKGKFVKIGDEILIKINYVDMYYIIPYIKGEIVDILMKSIKSEIDDDSGISTNDHQFKTKKKSNKNNMLDDRNKILEDQTIKTLLSEPYKEITKKSRKSKINSLIQEMNAQVSLNTESKDDMNITHSRNVAKIKPNRRRTIHEMMIPSGDAVLESHTLITNSNLMNIKKNKSNRKIENSPPISNKLKIKKQKHSDTLDEEGIEQLVKLKKYVKSPAFVDETKVSKKKKYENLNSRNEISTKIDKKLKDEGESKLKVATGTEENKLSKKIKSRRQTVSELLPTENIQKEEKKKHKKLNRSLDENDIVVEKSTIDSVDRSPQKSKKANHSKTEINLIEDDIQTIKNKLIQSILTDCSPKKQGKNQSLLDQASSNSNGITISKKRKKKVDSIETTEIYENETEATLEKHEMLDDSVNRLKKRKTKRKKLSLSSEKYPSLQLNTPHYVDYIPTNEVSTFHDSISPIKMKDRPNLSSPETKKYTSPAGSERRVSTKYNKPKRTSGLLSDFHSDLIAKYLNK